MKNLINQAKLGFLAILVLSSFAVVGLAGNSLAVVPVTDSGGSSSTSTPSDPNGTCSDTTTGGNVDQSKVSNCVTSTPVWKDVETIVNFLSAGVGLIVAGVVIVGGIQYTIAGDNPQALQSARKRITNGLIALFAFFFIYAFLQWLIPGGIFNK